MKHYQDSYSRLLDLLHRGEQLSYEQASRRLCLSMRHTQRLFREMADNGIPLRLGSKKPVVWYLPEEQRETNVRVDLSERELWALSVAAGAACSMPTPLKEHLSTGLGKLLDELPTEVLSFEQEEWIAHPQFDDSTFAAPDADVFLQLARAINDSRQVQIDYHAAVSNTWTYDRCIEPYGLATVRGSWILVAYCHLRHDYREFALAGITQLTETDTCFTRDDDFDFAAYMNSRFDSGDDPTPSTVRLLVAPEKAVFFERKRYHHTQQVEKMPDGQAVVTYVVKSPEAIRPFVQSWGKDVTVLDPPELVEILRAEAEELADRYAEG